MTMENDWGSPSDECAVCFEPVTDPVGFPINLTAWQYLAERFNRAFPDADLRITMCETCHEHLEVIEFDEDHAVTRDERSQGWEAIKSILDEIPFESLYIESSH